MKIIKESALLLILITFSRIYYSNGQLITNNAYKKDPQSSKETLNEYALKCKRHFYDEKNSEAYKFKSKRNRILLKQPSYFNFFLEINQLKNYYENNNPICNIQNCFMPHGVCVAESICKCSKYFGNLFMIDLKERIKINNNENLVSILLTQNEFSYYLSEYMAKFYSEIFCGYHRKSQLIAFILESIFLIGIGHFYLNRFFHGIYKLVLIFLILLLVFSMKRSKIEKKFFLSITSDKQYLDVFLNFIFFVLIANFIFVHVVDVIMIASNKYLDGFGFSMLTWNSQYFNN